MKLIIASTFLLLSSVASYAQSAACGEYTRIVKDLADRFGESRKFVATQSSGNIVVGFASDETGTWSILIVAPNGTACMVASGDGFEYLNESLSENL